MKIVTVLKYTLAGRIVLSVIAGLLFAIAISEGAHFLLKEDTDREPSRIELVIPAGTAERIAAGKPVPTIPVNMVFVIGDTLVVNNQDSVAHQLGPVWVPPGASASLAMELENSFAYACSFEPSRYLGLDVHSRTTLGTRLTGIMMAGPPMIVLIALYSLLVWPLKPKPAISRS